MQLTTIKNQWIATGFENTWITTCDGHARNYYFYAMDNNN